MLRAEVRKFGITNHRARTVNAKSMTVAAPERTQVGRRSAIPDGGAISGAGFTRGEGISGNLASVIDRAGETLGA